MKLAKVAEALKAEKDHEIEQHQALLTSSSIQERKEKGLTWYPVKFLEKKYALVSMPLIKLCRNVSDDSSHLFSVGSSVNIFGENTQEIVKGSVHQVQENDIWISVYDEDIPDWLDEMKIGINMSFDSKSYFEMEKALNVAINDEKGRISELRKVLYSEKKPSFQLNHEIEIPSLNESQNKALNHILNAEDIAIIHGPPGTGKTTTLVESIIQLSKYESNILVCAPSNAAVDHLASKLSEKQLKVCRIGNLSKIQDDLIPLTLEGQIQSYPEYKQISQFKKKALEARKNAEKFKRNFGSKEREERRALYKDAREYMKQSRETEDYLIDKIIRSTQVICTTLVGSAHYYLKNFDFNTAFIDEAAQAIEPSCWIPILKCQRLIMAGDPFQLPPTVKSKIAQKNGLSITLMEKTIRSNPSVLLKTQYRMNKDIMAFSNSWFYNDELIAHESVKEHAFNNEPAVEFIDTAGCGFDEKTDDSSFSKSNLGEIDLIRKRMEEFPKNLNESIGIISPYKEQVNKIRNEFKSLKNIAVNTIDSFQGQEKDLIIISLVRSNSSSEIGFLQDYRRMNVAMTRARKKLIVIGDSATIGQDKFYNDFLNFCESHGFYKSAWEYLYR